METYATALTYAIPGFVILIIIEEVFARLKGEKVNRSMDVISSLSSGMTNTLKSLLGLSIVLVSYQWMLEYFAVYEIKSTWVIYLVAFICIDFAGYWSHRFNHVINVFWNRHIVHHSSEEFNLSCALRQSISGVIGIYFFLYIPMALVGIPFQVVAIVAPVHLFLQFWYHTRLIGKMGFLESFLVTPSHHRVHHAINEIYLDKNFGQIFIFWDKWFGTFQEELTDTPPVFGVKKPVNTWNPFIINYMHVWGIFKDAWRTKRWVDKLKIWFMPTGWRPTDVATEYPIRITTDVYHREKYDVSSSTLFISWSWFQLVFTNVMLYYVLWNYTMFSANQLIWFGIFLATTIFAFTSAMDGKRYALLFDGIKTGIGLYILFSSGGWFYLEEWIVIANVLVIGYLVISLAVNWYHLMNQPKGRMRESKNKA